MSAPPTVEQLELVLESNIRRFLDSHAGNVSVKNVSDDGVVELEFHGACTSCPALPATLNTAIAPLLRQVDGVRDVVTPKVNVSRFAQRRLAQIATTTRAQQEAHR